MIHRNMKLSLFVLFNVKVIKENTGNCKNIHILVLKYRLLSLLKKKRSQFCLKLYNLSIK